MVDRQKFRYRTTVGYRYDIFANAVPKSNSERTILGRGTVLRVYALREKIQDNIIHIRFVRYGRSRVTFIYVINTKTHDVETHSISRCLSSLYDDTDVNAEKKER